MSPLELAAILVRKEEGHSFPDFVIAISVSTVYNGFSQVSQVKNEEVLL